MIAAWSASVIVTVSVVLSRPASLQRSHTSLLSHASLTERAALGAAASAATSAQDARDQAARLRDDHDRHAAALAAARQAQLDALGDTITELRQRLNRAEADTAAERGERQRLTAHLQETATRPASGRKTPTP